MPNPMLDQLSCGAKKQFAGAGNMSGGNGMTQMVQQFAQFKRMIQGRNPKQMVQNLLQSGQMSQAQFDQLKQQANALQNLLR